MQVVPTDKVERQDISAIKGLKSYKEGVSTMEYKYISSIPKPLLNDFVNGRVIPFVGAGFSKNADIPDGLSMPDWNELGKIVADEIPDYHYDNNAIDALSYYEDLYSRAKLIELLMKELHFGKVQPGSTYKAFCELFTGTICTTNFDSLIEDSMTLLHRPIPVIVTKDRLPIGSGKDNKIVKLHGDFNHPDKMVITEHDYDVYLDQNPVLATYVANLFIANTLLLIGYSLDDIDFRSVWQIINSRLGRMAQPAYCITVGASSEKVARYKRRNIRIINLKGQPQNYKTILHDFFVEINEYICIEKDKTTKSTNEKINEQMKIPAEDNKLCFISCSMSRIAQLSNLINPTLQTLGITPVRIDDMLMPYDNWIDISRTAIRKSKAAIIDVSDSSSNVMIELGLIKSTTPKNNVLILCEKNTVLPVSLINQRVLTYTFDITNEKDNYYFSKELKEWCRSVFNIISTSYDNNNNKHVAFADAYELLKKEDYSACIVSAYSELENHIFSHHTDFETNDKGVICEIFRINQYISNNYDSDYYKEIMTLHNNIVHQGYIATLKEAEDFLRFVTECREALDNFKKKNQKKQILWVDDSPENNVYERNVLEQYGLDFTLALSTQQALDFMQHNKFALIISDMRRKEGEDEGYVLLDNIRKNNKEIPFIVYAGSSKEEYKNEILKRGGQDYTNTPRELIDAVINTLLINL